MAEIAGVQDRPSAEVARALLLASARDCFAERGYAGSHVTGISRAAGLTTRAFYRHFNGKVAMYRALFLTFADDLQEALAGAADLEQAAGVWIEVSRRHQGVIRAGMEIVHRDEDATASQRRLRDRGATALASHLSPALPWRRARAAGLMLADMLDQYVLMELQGWIPRRPAPDVAAAMEGLVRRGLYGR